jgi:Polysaccharide lyase
VIFDGSFQPPSIRRWWGWEVAGPDVIVGGERTRPPRIALVPAPGLPGVWAARFTVTPKVRDGADNSGWERTEVLASPAASSAQPGQVSWYSWATYFPRGFRSLAGHSAFIFQAKRVNGRCGHPNLSIQVNTQPLSAEDPTLGMIRIFAEGGDIADNSNLSGSTDYCPGLQVRSFNLVRYRPAHWFYFMLRVAWSTDPRDGSVTAWVNRRLVLATTHAATLYSDSGGAYLHQGLYEAALPVPESDLQLGLQIGTSADAVSQGQLLPARPHQSR